MQRFARHGLCQAYNTQKRKGDNLSTIKASNDWTIWYIHFSSNHHDRVKRGVINCLRSRDTRICEAEDLAAEEEHRMTFQMNGYPKGFIAGARRPSRGQDETQQGEETATEEPTPGKKTLCVPPYVGGTHVV